MTAPITTTSSGSPRQASLLQESSLRSPLKRTHSDRQGSEDLRVEDGQRARPIKKFKQGDTGEGQGPDGIVARLFKYAWQFIGAPPEGEIFLLGFRRPLADRFWKLSNQRRPYCKGHRRGQAPDIAQDDEQG